MKFGVVVFPGSNCDHDCYHVVKHVLDTEATFIWHKERNLGGVDCVILPGGFSYGDYLRAGAIARFSPVMEAVVSFAERGGLVLGICNGFQILLEAGLLPGAMRRNKNLRFICQWVNVRVENNSIPFTRGLGRDEVLDMPIAHAEGNYFIGPEGLRALEEGGQVIFRYCTPEGEVTGEANPNGALGNIAGVCNRRGNVLGMMPHPERSAEKALGPDDGLTIFKAILGGSLS